MPTGVWIATSWLSAAQFPKTLQQNLVLENHIEYDTNDLLFSAT